MTYIVSGAALNPTHFLTKCIYNLSQLIIIYYYLMVNLSQDICLKWVLVRCILFA